MQGIKQHTLKLIQNIINNDKLSKNDTFHCLFKERDWEINVTPEKLLSITSPTG